MIHLLGKDNGILFQDRHGQSRLTTTSFGQDFQAKGHLLDNSVLVESIKAAADESNTTGMH